MPIRTNCAQRKVLRQGNVWLHAVRHTPSLLSWADGDSIYPKIGPRLKQSIKDKQEAPPDPPLSHSLSLCLLLSLLHPSIHTRLPLPLFTSPRQTEAKMAAMKDLLKEDDIRKALEAFKAADSFDHQKFFVMVGLKAMSAENVKQVFNLLDVDASGYIEEEELKFVLKGFSSEGRDLTDKETRSFLEAADKDGDGKIGIDEFEALVHQG
ncbi:hypothetical protein ACEWY4_018097 [Coilia grayii]|uniref:Parvalbumin n=1 Tax=Coilia grayii TaxID=363190 RepID=A0ABD1JIN8_9TELE